ncbi:MAG TPA: hypothetical protein VKG45_11665, partial [Actinomycetes bacterium]|nr:hypothetical protein [Actinomycetes bacterium]
PRPPDALYRLYVNVLPDDAPIVIRRLVTRFVERRQSGVPAASLAAPLTPSAVRDPQRLFNGVQTLRNPVQVTVADLRTAERVALDVSRYPVWLLDDRVPMADPLRPGISMAVELPGHANFGAVRSDAIEAALRAAPFDDFGTFYRQAHEHLRAAGVSPDAPHTQIDPYTQLTAPTFSPERRAWLQAEGSVTVGYHLGGPRSPAVTSIAVGSGLGVLLTGMTILVSPLDYPHAARDLAVMAGTGAAGGYLGGQIEFGLTAALARAELTWDNASFARGFVRMVLPRMLSGGVAGAVTALLMTGGVMVIDEVYFGADHTAADYAAIPARAAAGGAVAGGVGAGSAALTIYLLGGAAAGGWVPILGSIAGAAAGLVAYIVVDRVWGDDIEQAVRPEVDGQRPTGRAPRR